ncbi:MAG TPA: hypothetical protein VHD33_08370 [Legionellaceae bacterium]|nr:hypothetical protein [Legionellaceae bacterium]
MTRLTLDTRTLARTIELKQKLELERRNNAIIKTREQNKSNDDFFNRQLQIKLQPLSPSPMQRKIALSKKEAALQLSKQMRATHTLHGFPKKTLTPLQHTSEEQRKQFWFALKKFKHHGLAKKHHDKRVAQRERTLQEIEAQHQRGYWHP